jgi:hypothetical protein
MKHVVIILLSFILVSCHGVDKPKKPGNLLSKSEMVAVIVDITLFTSAKGVNKYELQQQGVLPEGYIYNKHNIDSLQFAKSNEYYSYDIEEYESIYQRVHDSLLALKTVYKRIEDEELQIKKEKDSIRKSNLRDGVKVSSDMINKKFKKPVSKIPDSLR